MSEPFGLETLLQLGAAKIIKTFHSVDANHALLFKYKF